jgi:uncharacterized protein YjiS (DUF1127 family)
MTDLTQPRPSTNDIRPEPAQNADRAGLLPTLWRRLCGAWRMALDEEHLTALDDRMLRDLGITRHRSESRCAAVARSGRSRPGVGHRPRLARPSANGSVAGEGSGRADIIAPGPAAYTK